MKVAPRVVLGLAAFAPFAPAQSPCGGLTVTVSPDPAPYGQPITVTLTNSTASTITIGSPCAFYAVHAGTPAGPSVYGVFCILVLTPIAPGGSVSQAWDQETSSGQQVPPGVYWFDLNEPIGTAPCFASVTIDPCASGSIAPFGSGCGAGVCGPSSLGALSLNAENCPLVGSNLSITLANGDCNSPAALALGASNASWLGVPLPLNLGGGCFLHVSLDVVLGGATGSLGLATFGVTIPPDPSLQGVTVYAEGATAAGGVLKTSNALALTIG